MSYTSSSPKVKAAADERARLRRNQRNSRARKQEYVHDLERRWAECVKLGVQASVEIQREARNIHEENAVLRDVIRELGMTDDALRQRLHVAIGARNLQHDSVQNYRCVPPTISPNSAELAPALPSSAMPLPDLGQAITVPVADAHANDALQTWDLYSWVNDLAEIKDAYSFNAQSQVDYGDAYSDQALLSSDLGHVFGNAQMPLPVGSNNITGAWPLNDHHVDFENINDMFLQTSNNAQT